MSAAGRRAARARRLHPGIRCVRPAGAGLPSRSRSTAGRWPVTAYGWAGEGLRLAAPQTARPVARPAGAGRPPRRSAAALGDRAAAARARPAEAAATVAAERQRACDLIATRRCRARPVQARAAGAQTVAEPAGASGSGARARGASLSRIAGARAHRGGAGGNLPRDAGGDRSARVCRSVGTGRAGRGAGRRAHPRSNGEAQALSGQIDRLVVTPERVLIVDYKTLRPPPENEDEVPAGLSAPDGDLPRRAAPHLSRSAGRMRAAMDRGPASDADRFGAARPCCHAKLTSPGRYLDAAFPAPLISVSPWNER